jgi:aspartyl-tRNA(Asn)/glutamyl-tRNA(Gln) amidotransferase subunit B
LEEDTGSLMHPEGADYSLVNLNRAGIPLMELVTEPDITSGKQAREFAQELQIILRYLGVSSADMEKGQMRVEVNISISKNNKLGTKVEIKNLNSFKVVEKAIDYEMRRQTEVLEKGGKVVQETRGWHDKKGTTFSQREKEEAHDYRYFPEPDLPPMHFDKDYLKEIKLSMTELPEQRRERFKKEYGLDEASTEFFVTNKDLGEYFEKVVSEFEEWTEEQEKGEAHKKAARLVANYLITDVQGLLQGKEFSAQGGPASGWKITPENFAEFVKMIYKNEISSKAAKMVLLEMFNTGDDPSDIVEKNNWRQMSDSKELEKVVKDVISKNPKAVADFKAGKQNALQFLAGQVMSATRGTANPGKLRELLNKFLH